MSPDMRQRILRAALELVASEGVGNLTNRQVADRAGVALGSLSYHFESQSVLLRESLRLFISEESQRLEQLNAQLAAAELNAEQAVLALEALLSVERERRLAKLELYLAASRDEQLRDAALQCFAAYDSLAATALTSLGLPEPNSLAGLFVAIIDGLQLRRLATGQAELQVAEPLTVLLRALRE